MAIKKLQNNFTTPEQSKRLLELGVPEDSADMVLVREKAGDMQFYDYDFEKVALNWGEKFSDWDTLGYTMNHHVLPCWSVGRLMEIYDICVGDTESWPTVKQDISYVINTIVAIDYAVREGRIDFSKLEE